MSRFAAPPRNRRNRPYPLPLSSLLSLVCRVVLCRQVDVTGFPTLFFFPGKGKEAPMRYEGARETLDLAKYIRDNVSVRCAAKTAWLC